MLIPLPAKLWNRTLAAHLLNRAGFGGTPVEIDQLASIGMDGAVASFLNPVDDGDLFPVPELTPPAKKFDYQKRMKAAPDDIQRRIILKEMQHAERNEDQELRIWWLNRMRYTSAPLIEKATLFWHGHFATSFAKVKNPYQMWQQNETLRRYALGKFPELLKAISRDAAMIRWLDLNQSNKSHPNENFAREVMELFSLGEGNYTEKDIQEAARAFTGYRVKQDDGTFLFVPKNNDNGQKTVFGKMGAFTGDQIIDLIVSRPECARFLGKKLWVYFVSENPSQETISQVASILMGNGYDIGATLGEIFRSAAFYSSRVVHHQIKGPVQWMIQTTKMLEIPLPDQRVLDNAMASLGQIVFTPPNVKGWDGGRAWISSSSLLYRYNLASYLLSGKAKILGGKQGSTAVLPLDKIVPPDQRVGSTVLLDHLLFRVFNVPIPVKDRVRYVKYLEAHNPPYANDVVRDLMQVMMSTPEFQLC